MRIVVLFAFLGVLMAIDNRHLRGLFEKEKNKLIHESVEKAYNGIYSNVIYLAKQGETEMKFSLFCISHEDDLERIVHVERTSPSNLYSIKWSELVPKVVDKIKHTFPEITLTSYRLRQDNCEYFSVKW
jgi:hypothetical protein